MENHQADSKDYHRAIETSIPSNLDNIRIILFEPQGPLNIGATARSIKGMGLSQFYLVNPKPFLDCRETWYMSHGATDIIRNCHIVESLGTALEGIQFLVGTTHRRRKEKLARPATARDAAKEIVKFSQDQQVAILFGREDFGLSTEHVSRCHLTASIPMAMKNPSLNLAQAVQIFAYEIFLESLENTVKPVGLKNANIEEVERFYQRLLALVERIGVKPRNGDWKYLMRSVRRVFSRTGLEDRDIGTLDLIFSSAHRYINRLEEQLQSDRHETAENPVSKTKN